MTTIKIAMALLTAGFSVSFVIMLAVSIWEAANAFDDLINEVFDRIFDKHVVNNSGIRWSWRELRLASRESLQRALLALLSAIITVWIWQSIQAGT